MSTNTTPGNHTGTLGTNSTPTAENPEAKPMPWGPASKNPAYNQAKWRRARLACLRRAGWRCEIRLEGVCVGAASQADHIDGLAADPDHQRLRAACTPCHRKVTALQGGGNRPPADPKPRPRTSW